MTRWFVTRHPGALEWARRMAILIDRRVAHLDAQDICAGDIVMGTLPFDLAAEVCRRGAKFYSLVLTTDESQRGRPLSADDLEAAQARLQRYAINAMEDDDEL